MDLPLLDVKNYDRVVVMAINTVGQLFMFIKTEEKSLEAVIVDPQYVEIGAKQKV